MTVPPIISGLGKATNFKFGRYIQSVHTNKSRLIIWEKLERGRIQGLPKCFEYPLLSQERIQAMNFKFGRYIYRVHPNKSPLKFWEKMERGRIEEVPQFFEYPLLSQERVKLRTSNFASIFTGSMRTKTLQKTSKTLKIWENRERGRIQGIPNFLKQALPPIISGTGKATKFNFCTHILSIDCNRSPLKISGKVAGCVVRTLKTFQGTHILDASRGLLCDSSAVLLKLQSRMSGSLF